MDANNGGMLGAWLMCYGGQYWPFPPVDGAEHFGVRRLAAAFAP